MDELARYGSPDFASSAQYSMRMLNMTMKSEVANEKGLIDMMKQQQQMLARGPQPGDVPAAARGSFFDTYA